MSAPADRPRMDPSVAARLAGLAQAVGTAWDLETVFRGLRDFLVEAVPFHAVGVSLYDPRTRLRTLVYAATPDEEVDVEGVPPAGPSGTPHAVAVETGEVVVVDDLQDELEGRSAIFPGSDPETCHSAIAVPMEVRGRVIGGFEIQCREPAAYDEQDGVVLRLAANLAATAVESVRLVERERELREAAEAAGHRFEDLVEGLDAVVWEAVLADEEYPDFIRFTFVSRQVESMLGYPPERWIEEPGFWTSIIHPDDRAGAIARCREATERGEDHDLEYRIRRADGATRHVRELVRVEDEGSVRVRGILVDVTETKQMEAHLLEAGKMEVVGRLAGGIAHDFNNLLTVIKGNLDLLLRDHPPGDVDHERLEEIHEAAGRAAALTRQLLAFGRRQPKRVRRMAVNRAVRNVRRMLRRLIGEDIDLRFDLAPDAGVIRADPNQVEQALINLAVNARDAMPEGGPLEIATRRDDELVILEVADRGVGMDQATRERVFEPFFSTKPEGTGLGLSTVYAIVTDAGGTIEVDSEPGGGTRFRIRWPAVEGPAELRVNADRGEAPEGRGETILLVEDEPGVRRLARRVLERAGYMVVEAADGEGAMDRLEREGALPDLLLTDIVMPGLGGPELVERARRIRPGLRSLLMSGYHDEIRLGRGTRAGGEVLEKPFRSEDLLRRVRAALDDDLSTSTI